MSALPTTIGELANRRPTGSTFGAETAGLPAGLAVDELVARVLGAEELPCLGEFPVVFPDGDRGFVATEDLLAWFREAVANERSRNAIDELTGLPARAAFVEELEEAVELLNAPEAKPLALLYFGMDGFRSVNDTLGHQAGDQLLSEVGRRLRTTSRKSETVARLGGDEFGVLISDAGSSDPFKAADRLRRELREPWTVNDQLVPLRASVGVAVMTDPALGAQELLRRADVAMSGAKQSGRDCVRTWSDEIDARFGNHLDLLTDLAEALEHDLLHLVYQPYFDLSTGAMAGAEALVRWEHEERGTIFPDQFIPLAERSGMINTLGHWVLRTACRQASAWIDEGLLRPGSLISVNVSPPELMDTGFETIVMNALAQAGLSPERLQLEITETAVLEDTEVAAETLQRLRRSGVQIAIDDFGTGFASMTYLRRLPVDAIKIDKSFVDGVVQEPRDELIVGGIVQLANALGLEVIAEGIESADQASVLAELGCHKAQGYHFSRPQTADAFLAAVDEAETRA